VEGGYRVPTRIVRGPESSFQVNFSPFSSWDYLPEGNHGENTPTKGLLEYLLEIGGPIGGLRSF